VNVEHRTAWLSTAEREDACLAPYAMRSHDSLGRKHPEESHPYRGCFQRDRDRIVHCSAYRRLSGKTQVFTGMGDYHRTRLTHTLEVASIARTMGRVLGLNEDLVEAMAMLHDIGHPPFGHAGEDTLDECLAEHGGFSHNQFALTLVEELESRYPDSPGLNLSAEVLEGQRFRSAKPEHSAAPGEQSRRPLLEAQIVESADSITYDAHDTDDAVKLGMVTLAELAEIPLVARSLEIVRQRHGALPPSMLRKTLVRHLIDEQVGCVLQASLAKLAEHDFHHADEARAVGNLIGVSSELAAQKKELEDFLYQRVYRHPRIIDVRKLAQSRLKKLFTAYRDQPRMMPRTFRKRTEQVGVERGVVECIAGMTDRFFNMKYEELFGSIG